MQAQHGARLFPRWIRLFLVGIEQQVQESAINATRCFDNPGNIAFFGNGIGIAQVVIAILAVAREVPVLPPVDAFPLLPAENRLIFDIKGLFGVVGQFVRAMFAEAQAILVIEQPLVPLEAFLFPEVKPLLHLAGMHKEL